MFHQLVTPRKGKPTVTNTNVGSSVVVQIAAVNPSRKSITIQNQGAVTVFIGFGNPNVATSGANTGYALFTGTTVTDDATDQAIYALAASSTALLNVTEVS